ncbi:MAG: PilZ domain-containing protein [Candidatus Omnitrophica bacterium]|nr:PilZ domain-containing protein [Candidatus Omnitrophota bacterium]
MWQGVDKREFPRVNYPCKIVVTQQQGAPFNTKTENIGVGGVCVILEKGFERFTEVSLEIFINNGLTPIKCEGKIMWVIKKTSARPLKSEQFDTGIEFTGLSGADKARIEGIVKEHMNDADEG